MYSVLRFVM